jgi:two-component system, response regulator PdtaR
MLTEYAGPWNPVPRAGPPSVPSLSRVPAPVLIVEDEALVRALGVGLFADAGFRPIEAADSDEALEILGANAEVQLLFTDVNLPGSIDGLALARQVCDRWPHIGIIFVSGRSAPQLHEFPAGCRFHRKPYDWDLVVSHARELTAAKRSPSSAQPAASSQKWRE